MMAVWDDVITEQDKEVYWKSGHGGRRIVPGDRPALLIIDVTYDFIGNEPEPVLKSIERFPLSCGESGWQAMRQIASLLPLARERKIPIIYSVGETSMPKKWTGSNPRAGDVKANRIGNEIAAEIAPQPGDIVIRKFGPSIFLQTPLINVLTALQVDTVLCTGGVTSGCVRASVVDAATYGYNVVVIEECVFDRFEVSHKINLFDMNAKYANVMPLAQARGYLERLAAVPA
ncbi:MAG: isochorismatase family protein [Chloroflexi bacterium]|nr:isochorismatase family protein [Chloroflexota bacterium]